MGINVYVVYGVARGLPGGMQLESIFKGIAPFMIAVLIGTFRAAEKMNYPNLLVSWPLFGVAASDEYLDMHRLPRLEYGPTSGAIWDNLFFPRP